MKSLRCKEVRESLHEHITHKCFHSLERSGLLLSDGKRRGGFWMWWKYYIRYWTNSGVCIRGTRGLWLRCVCVFRVGVDVEKNLNKTNETFSATTFTGDLCLCVVLCLPWVTAQRTSLHHRWMLGEQQSSVCPWCCLSAATLAARQI